MIIIMFIILYPLIFSLLPPLLSTAADSLQCRDILLDADVVEGLRPFMSSKRISMMKNVTWTMSNLCNVCRNIKYVIMCKY